MRPIPSPARGVVNRAGVETFYHKVVLTTAGVISSQDDVQTSGVVATKTATETGRYTLTLAGGSTYKSLLWVDAKIIGADDAAYGAATLGLPGFIRDNDISGGALDGTVEWQFVAGDTNWADAEVADSVTLLFEIVVSNGV